ncbi:MAG: DUF202 domain-containing protein [Burkholderiaceae bacterium]
MRDAGLQPERTALAWSRTFFAMAVNCLLIVRQSFVQPRPILIGLSILVVGVTFLVYFATCKRRKQLSADVPRPVSIDVCLPLVGGIALAATLACLSIAAS